jgi:hypothetical protein
LKNDVSLDIIPSGLKLKLIMALIFGPSIYAFPDQFIILSPIINPVSSMNGLLVHLNSTPLLKDIVNNPF